MRAKCNANYYDKPGVNFDYIFNSFPCTDTTIEWVHRFNRHFDNIVNEVKIKKFKSCLHLDCSGQELACELIVYYYSVYTERPCSVVYLE